MTLTLESPLDILAVLDNFSVILGAFWGFAQFVSVLKKKMCQKSSPFMALAGFLDACYYESLSLDLFEMCISELAGQYLKHLK